MTLSVLFSCSGEAVCEFLTRLLALGASVSSCAFRLLSKDHVSGSKKEPYIEALRSTIIGAIFAVSHSEQAQVAADLASTMTAGMGYALVDSSGREIYFAYLNQSANAEYRAQFASSILCDTITHVHYLRKSY